MLLLVKYLEVPTTTPLAFHTYWLVASVHSLGPAPFHIWLHFSSSTLLFISAAWVLGAAVELVIVLSAHLAICWWNDWQSSLVVLKILPFPQRSFCLGPQKRRLRRAVLSRKIQEAERSHRLHPEVFFTDHRLSTAWFFSGFWKLLIHKGHAEKLFQGISIVSSITKHNVCLSLPCPLCLSADHF